MVGVRRGGQAFSMDLIIGVLVFLLAIGIIYTLIGSDRAQDTTALRVESEVIAERLTSASTVQVAQGNQLEMDNLAAVAKSGELNYEALKEQLGITEEFCIYLTDDQGNLVYINGSGAKYPGIGSGSGEINLTQWDVPCGKPCTASTCG